MNQGRDMGVIVTDIRPGDSPAIYIVDMTVNGEARSFQCEVRLPHMESIGADSAFERVFCATHGVSKIVSLVLAFHQGESVNFPVAVQVVDFKQIK